MTASLVESSMVSEARYLNFIHRKLNTNIADGVSYLQPLTSVSFYVKQYYVVVKLLFSKNFN